MVPPWGESETTDEGSDAAFEPATPEGGGESTNTTQIDDDRYTNQKVVVQCCCLPSVFVQVSSVLANDNSTSEEIVQAFEAVEVEIFKLLAYDPFLRFKRQEA